MRTVRIEKMSPRQRMRRIALAVLAAGMTGAISAFVRPRITGDVHYEAIVSVLVILPTICLALVVTSRRVPWRWAIGWLMLEISAVCAAYVLSWFAVFGQFRADYTLLKDMATVLVTLWVILSAASLAILFIWQRFRRPLTGPYCPGCGYWLIGVPSDRCPECGREFTLDELGITREELQPGVFTVAA